MKHKILTAGAPADVPAETAEKDDSSHRSTMSRQLALTVLWGVVGLLVPRAHIYGGMAPLGVAAAAAIPGPGALLVYALTTVGYLLPSSTVFPYRYIAAIVAVAGIKWSLSGIKALQKQGWFSPVLSFLTVSGTGIALNIAMGPSFTSILMSVCEGLLAAGFTFFYADVMELCTNGQPSISMTATQQASLAIVGSVLLMALSDLHIGSLSPGRILAAMLILVFARCGREQGGCIAGTILGMAMALSGKDATYLAPAYAFGGLLAGIFSRFGRFATAGCFLLADTIVSVSSGNVTAILVGMYEALAAGVLYVAMPPVLDRKINGIFLRSQDLCAVEGLRRSVTMRLEHASDAMKEVSGTVETVSRKLEDMSAPSLNTMYREVADDACRVCGLRRFCWEQHPQDVMKSLEELTPVLREKGRAERDDLTGHLAQFCSRPDDLLATVNSGYQQYGVREGAFHRLNEIRSVIVDQFSSMSDMLSELSGEFDSTQRVDADAAQRVSGVCEQYGFVVHDVSCLIGRGGHLIVEILASEVHGELDQSRWHHDVCNACGCVFDHPKVDQTDGETHILLLERTHYRLELGTAQLSCTGEKLCGDALETFRDDTGRFFVVLSDGMGSGGRAAVDGAMAAGLTARLIQAGFGADSVLRMVNSALMVKSGDESLATLDIAAIDLFTGRMESLKAGACFSLLRSMGRVSRTERSSLPMGILREVEFERSGDTLVNGDILLLMSDGVITNGTAWVEEMLRDYEEETGNVTDLAQTVAREARRRQAGGHEDDITVAAVRMVKRKKVS